MAIGYIQRLSVPKAVIRLYRAVILFNLILTGRNLQKYIEN
jgi:hypothetical protein